MLCEKVDQEECIQKCMLIIVIITGVQKCKEDLTVCKREKWKCEKSKTDYWLLQWLPWSVKKTEELFKEMCKKFQRVYCWLS